MYSPVEQFIIYPVISFNLTINNVIFFLFIAAFLTLFLGNLISNRVITNNWGILSESLFRSILFKIESNLGPKYSIYLPLMYSIFHIVLFSNLVGMVPYSSTPTVEIVKTLSVAFTLLMGILLIGFLTHKLYLLAIFLPGGIPVNLIPLLVGLEIIAYLTRTFSLGLRLAINLMTGHILAKVIISFIWLGYLKGTSFLILAIPLFLLTIFMSLEFLICYLQAYILTFITIITLKDISMA
jgi:F-type H+-transporting ATPase subunit a